MEKTNRIEESDVNFFKELNKVWCEGYEDTITIEFYNSKPKFPDSSNWSNNFDVEKEGTKNNYKYNISTYSDDNGSYYMKDVFDFMNFIIKNNKVKKMEGSFEFQTSLQARCDPQIKWSIQAENNTLKLNVREIVEIYKVKTEIDITTGKIKTNKIDTKKLYIN